MRVLNPRLLRQVGSYDVASNSNIGRGGTYQQQRGDERLAAGAHVCLYAGAYTRPLLSST
jgi:hypothetical protein